MRLKAGVLPTLSAAAVTAAVFMSSWAYTAGFSDSLALYKLLPLAAAALLAVHSLTRMRMEEPSALEFAAFAFLSWSMLTYIWSRDPTRTAWHITNFVVNFATMLLTVRLSKHERFWRWMGWAYVAGCSIASCEVLSSGLDFVATGAGLDRATIGDANPNYAAYVIATSVPIALTLFTVTRGKLARLLLVGHIALALAATMFTGSRGATAAVGAAIAVLYLVRFRRNVFGSIFFLAAVAAAAVFLFDYLPEGTQQRMQFFQTIMAGQGGEVDFSGRDSIWWYAFNVLDQELVAWFGVGFGAFPAINPGAYYAHNAVLSMLVETGVIGLALYLLLLLAIFVRAWRGGSLSRSAGLILFAAWIPMAMTGVWEAAAPVYFAFGWVVGAAYYPLAPVAQSTRAALFTRFAIRFARPGRLGLR